MTNILMRLALVMLLACGAGGVSAQSDKPTDPPATTGADASGPPVAGKIDLIEGEVRVFDSNRKPRKPGVGDVLHEGDSIVTGKDGELHLNMEDGGYVAVRPGTRMRIVNFRAQGDDDDKGVFGLLQGSFRSITGWIGKFRPDAYQVRTPTATIGIRGTDHEPLVIPQGASDGEPGTYDKVNAGGSYIQTPQGRVDVPPGKAAFAPHTPKPGQKPHVLAEVPHHFRPTRNEHRLEKRHEDIQQKLEHLRELRRKNLAQHAALRDKPREAAAVRENERHLRQQKQEEAKKHRQEERQQKLAEKRRQKLEKEQHEKPDEQKPHDRQAKHRHHKGE